MMTGILGLIIALSGFTIVLALNNIEKQLSCLNDKLDHQEQKETE